MANLSGQGVLLRIYLQSADRPPHTPTYERIVKLARREDLAGATVLKGILGYGSRGMISGSPWRVVEHVPVIVEVVDTGERVIRFLRGPLIEQTLIGGMVTLERASVIFYGAQRHREQTILSPRADFPELKTQLQGDRMTINENGVLLRAFIGESDRHAGRPLYEAIVQKARELSVAGATVLRGVEGFGANSVVHKAQLLEMSSDLPIVIEVVDTEEKINTLLPQLEQMVEEGMITMERVAIVLYRHNPQDKR